MTKVKGKDHEYREMLTPLQKCSPVIHILHQISTDNSYVDAILLLDLTVRSEDGS